jgi:hypothetical protein
MPRTLKKAPRKPSFRTPHFLKRTPDPSEKAKPGLGDADHAILIFLAASVSSFLLQSSQKLHDIWPMYLPSFLSFLFYAAYPEWL